jgi:hypothetical protein
VKLRSFLHRRHADQVPLLPAIEPADAVIERTGSPPTRGPASSTGSARTIYTIAQEERLERLLTPTELDLVREHRV